MIAPARTARTRVDPKNTIGLEVHVQLATRTKMFCGDAVLHGGPPNRAICPVCIGLPGALPVLNARAVELGIRAAHALGCTIHDVSRFVRKSYFYPDLPKGYQITQLDEPLATGGVVTLRNGNAVRIRRVHLEEDAGKLLHDRFAERTAIDLNRCGVPLLEIVTEPDITSAADAVAFAKALKQLLMYADVSDCDMELGSLRVDANVSIGSTARTELKNINSFTQLERAIEAELALQIDLVETGGEVLDATYMWDADAQDLRLLRAKEQREQYRYLDEPDLPPLVIPPELRARAIEALPELPQARVARYVANGVSPQFADVLTAARSTAEYFDAVTLAGADPVLASKWIATHALAWCNANHADMSAYPVAPAAFATVLLRASLPAASIHAALHQLEQGARDMDAILTALGEAPDARTMQEAIDAVLAEEAALVGKYRAGAENLFGHFMGRVMQRLGKAADPAAAAALLRDRLQGP